MEARATLCAGKFPMYFKALENILKENGETGKTIAGFLFPISPFFWSSQGVHYWHNIRISVPIFEQNANFGPIFEKSEYFGPIFEKSVNFEHFVKGR